MSIVVDNVFGTEYLGPITLSKLCSMLHHVEPTPRVKMEDVARTAGVSVATVSKVVNGRYGVAQATLTRVQEVIDELGYEASLGARSLRSHRTNVLGILVAEFEPFSTELLKGASSAVGSTGYELLAYSGGGRGADVGWERRYLSRLSGTLIDGAIIVTPTVRRGQHRHPRRGRRPAHRPHRPADRRLRQLRRRRAGHRAPHRPGHRRIGYLGGRLDLESARLREDGFRKAMDTAGIPVDESLVAVGEYRPESADAPARVLLGNPDRPTAVFAANDLSAIQVMAVAGELGMTVPDDLSVIGFDNVPESALASPPLTTINQPLQEMGAAALRLLVDLIDGRERSAHLRLPTELVVRASCAPPRR